jgi:formyl-CoA transferase
MLDASVVLLTSLATPYLVSGKTLPRTGDVGYSGSPTSSTFVTGDGCRLALGVVQNNHFELLCALLGRAELALDARFREPASRADPQNAPVLREVLSQIFLTRAGAEWEGILCGAGIPCGLVRDIGEICEAARTDTRGLITPTIAAVQGAAQPAAFVNAGFVFGHDGPGSADLAPMLGEHSDAVLRSLGYSDAQIRDLDARDIVRFGKRHPGRAQG